MKITRKELGRFGNFVEVNGLEDRFIGCEALSSSIYFNSGVQDYLSWDEHSDDDTLIKVVKAINAIFDLDLELVL